MDQSLANALSFVGLSYLQVPLSNFGIQSPYDLQYFNEWDFVCSGLTWLESRKLLSVSKMACAMPPVLDLQGSLRQMEIEADMTHASELCRVAATAEQTAVSSLARSLDTGKCTLESQHVSVQSMEHALQCLSEQPRIPRKVVFALNAVERALASCPCQELRNSLACARRALRDVLVWRVQLRVPFGCRQAFVSEIMQANGGSIDQIALSQYLQSHSKVVCNIFPSAFLSNVKMKDMLKGRGPRLRKDKNGGESLRSEVPARKTQASEYCRESTGKLKTVPPPGLEIVEVASEVSLGTFATGGKRHACKRDVGKTTIIHKSNARTQYCTNPSEIGTSPDLDHDDPLKFPDDQQAQTNHSEHVLVLAELHPVLAWMKQNQEERSTTRPGVTSLVSSMLKMPDVTFAIASSVSHWWLLPHVRFLLEETVPDKTWRVEESFEGAWTSYPEGLSYNISGVKLSSQLESAESDNWAPCDWVLHYNGNHECSVEFEPGKWTWGRLTPEGFLEWDYGEDKWIWVRAGRQAPPCYVSSDGSMRVCVFDKYMVTERIYEEAAQGTEFEAAAGGVGWVLRKELHSVWSAMSEAGFGTFGPANTILLDERASVSSHPGNAIAVPDWEYNATASVVEDLKLYLEALVMAKPSDVRDYLQIHSVAGSGAVAVQ